MTELCQSEVKGLVILEHLV